MYGFAKISNVKGTTAVKGHAGELEFDSLTFAAAGGEQTPPVFDHVTLTRSSDLATPVLLEALHRGTSFEEVGLSIGSVDSTASGSVKPAFVITLGEVTVRRVRTVWKEEGRLIEEIEFSYRRISWSVNHPDGRTASFSAELPSSRLER
jgi:type VI protein secretion system component Hcp